MKGSEKEGIWDKWEEEKRQLAARLHRATCELLQPFFTGWLEWWERKDAPVSFWATCRRKTGNHTVMVGIEGIWWNYNPACSNHGVTGCGNLLRQLQQIQGSKYSQWASKQRVSTAAQVRRETVWGGAGSREMVQLHPAAALVECNGVMFCHQTELNRTGSVHRFSCTSLHWLSQISHINATLLWCWETSIMEINCSIWMDEWKLHNCCPISEKSSNVEWVQPNLIAVTKIKERTSIQKVTRRKAMT